MYNLKKVISTLLMMCMAFCAACAAEHPSPSAELTGVESTGVGSWEFTIAFAVGTLGLVFTFAKAGLIKISRTSPLALLQGR